MTIDIRSMFQTWLKVLTNPGTDVFEAERRKPSTISSLPTSLQERNTACPAVKRSSLSSLQCFSLV